MRRLASSVVVAMMIGCGAFSSPPESVAIVQHEIAAMTTLAMAGLYDPLDVRAVLIFGESIQNHVDDIAHGRTIVVRGKDLPR